MLGEFMLDIVFSIVNGAFELLPDFAWNVDGSAFATFCDLLKVVVYLFPIDAVLFVLSVYTFVQSFKINIAILRTVWEILPLV